jgi:anti-anti-sigma regulatory factor
MPQVEVNIRDGRALVVAFGTFTAARAAQLSDLVDDLVRRPDLRRVSVDITCVEFLDRTGAAIARLMMALPRSA